MTRETRIGLLVGLMFIVMFGLVLSELAGTEGVVSSPPPGQELGLDAAAEEIATFCVMPTPPPTAVRPTPVAPTKDSSSVGIRRPPATVAVGRVAPRPAARPPVPTPGVFPPRTPEHLVLMAMAREAALPLPSRPSRPSRPPSRPVRVVRTPPSSLPPIPTVAVAPRRVVRKYIVRKEDSLIGIARQEYGESRWQEYKRIFKANRGILSNESALRPGQVLVIPPLPAVAGASGGVVEATTEQLRARFARDGGRPTVAASSRARRLYRVRSGDNLTSIARRMLHDGSRSAVQRIVNANKSKISNPNDLSIGATLVIPS